MTIETFENGDLLIRVTDDEAAVTMEWEGSSESRDPDVFLAPLLQKLAARCKNKVVTIDLSALRYVNSATVAPILNLMKELDQAEVKTTIYWDEKIGWQRFNFICMKTIARTLPRIAVESR